MSDGVWRCRTSTFGASAEACTTRICAGSEAGSLLDLQPVKVDKVVKAVSEAAPTRIVRNHLRVLEKYAVGFGSLVRG